MTKNDESESLRAVEAWLTVGLGKSAARRTETSRGLAVLSVADGPTQARAFATVGLCLIEYPREPEVGRNRFEIVAASRAEDLAGYVTAAAFVIGRSKMAPLEGRVVRDLAAKAGMAELAQRFPHAVFLPPLPWDEIDVLRLPAFTLVPVFALPVSDAEVKFLKSRGTKAFIELIRKSKVDTFDLSRQPMVVDRSEAH